MSASKTSCEITLLPRDDDSFPLVGDALESGDLADGCGAGAIRVTGYDFGIGML